MNKITLVLSGICIVFLLLLALFVKLYIDMKAEKNRIKSNFEQVTNDNAILNVINGELSNVNNEMTAKYDSVLKANKIKENEVKTATITDIKYKDDKKEFAETKQPEQIKEPEKYNDIKPIEPKIYSIPVFYESNCWGFTGEILSNDPNSQLLINNKTANNNVQALITRKRVLGFLWWNTKKEKLQVFSDCGEANVTQINYNRK